MSTGVKTVVITRQQREIDALDFAVCQVIGTIDETLRPLQQLGWRPLGQTFKYEARNRDPNDSLQTIVFVYPAGWPDSSRITFYLDAFGPEWHAHKGTIYASHLPAFDIPVAFRFQSGCPSFITPRGSGGIYEKVREGVRLRRPDLVGKPGWDL